MRQDPDAQEIKFLQAALPDVIFDGWTDALMERTAGKLGWPASKIKQHFPRGAADLAVCLSLWATGQGVKAMEKADLGAMRVRDRVTLGVRAQLEALGPHKTALSSALTLLGLRAPKLVWHAADRIWWTAGDTSTDYNHYTKRGLLSGVITATTFYWINDASKNHEDTWRFLDRRIDNVLTVGKKLAQFRTRKEA